jgi:hypothetical protein
MKKYLLRDGKKELENSVTGWRKGTGKSVMGWKKGTGEICSRVEKGNWGNLLQGGRDGKIFKR